MPVDLTNILMQRRPQSQEEIDLLEQERARQMTALNNQAAVTPGEQDTPSYQAAPQSYQSIPMGLPPGLRNPAAAAESPVAQQLRNKLFGIQVPDAPKGLTYGDVYKGVEGMPYVQEQREALEAQKQALQANLQAPISVDVSPIAGYLSATTGRDWSGIAAKPADRQSIIGQLQQQIRLGQGQLSEEQRRTMQDYLKDFAARGGGGGAKDIETNLRKEFNNLKVIKNTSSINESYAKVNAAAGDPSAAGDLSLIFAYMKILDPESAVREKEQADASNARGVPESIRAQWNRVLSGERLGPNQRQDFVNHARHLYDAQLDAQRDAVDMYTRLAKEKGLRPENVVMPLRREEERKKEKVPLKSEKSIYVKESSYGGKRFGLPSGKDPSKKESWVEIK